MAPVGGARSTGHTVGRPPGRDETAIASTNARRIGVAETLVAVAFFVVLCVAALIPATKLMEPDDHAYRASIVALSHGHVTLSASQYQALGSELGGSGTGKGAAIQQWVHLGSGRWVSEKNPGYPFFAVPFQLLGLLRFAPLFYGALGCLGLFAGGRRWLGRWGGTWAVGLFCSSGAAVVFAWRDTMPTFTGASLVAAGTGALLWTVLAGEAGARRRTIVGLLGFIALEGAVFIRYTDVVVLGCGVLAVLLVRWLAPRVLPRRALLWWLGSLVAFGVLVLAFDYGVYGNAFSTGYASGEITFGLGAVAGNLKRMPPHLIKAMPALALALAGLVWIVTRDAWLRRQARASSGQVSLAEADRDLAVGAALGASWLGVWALYAMYYWTAQMSGGGSTVHVVRFFVPALAPIALLAAWPLARMPRWLAGAAIVAFFAVGLWSFTDMRTNDLGPGGGMPGGPGMPPGPGGPGQGTPPPLPQGGQPTGLPQGQPPGLPQGQPPTGPPPGLQPTAAPASTAAP